MAIIAAVSIVPIVAAAGFGIDYARLALVRSELQRGVDAAALGGARVINAEGSNTDEVVGDARMYFWANYRHGLADASIVGSNPAVTIVEPNRDTIEVVAQADVPLAFGAFLGYGNERINAVASAQRSVGGMEVALVLDNTGSMSRGTRIADLKSGAKALIDILYGAGTSSDSSGSGHGSSDHGSSGSSGKSDEKKLSHCDSSGRCTTEYQLTIGIVPFITTVNVSPGRSNGGNGKGSIVDPNEVSRKSWGRGNGWKGCVMARPYPFEESRADAPPSVSPFAPYIWPATSAYGNNPWNADTTESWPGNGAPAGQSAINKSTVGAGDGRETGPNKGCGQPLMPLQISRTIAKDQIDGLQVGASNGTAVPIGLAWGWRLLSPDWRPYWADSKTKSFPNKKAAEGTTPADLPRDYGTKNYEKVIVLFTDGENSISNSNASGYGEAGTLTTTLGSYPVTEVNRRTSEICTAIKAKGVKIYVVLLYPDPPTSLLNLYNENGCASGKSFFFHASSETQLTSIFSEVGSQLRNLRLVK